MSLACSTDRFCRVCGGLFHPMNSMASVCSPPCATKYAKGLGKERKAKQKVERTTTRARKAALKTIPDLIKEADKVFAAYIRTRDRLAGYPCISSGKSLDWSGNQVDAGHWRSRGAASHLRYHPDNCHAQSKFENRHRAGNAVAYRIGLIERIGIVRVETLEKDNAPVKWTRDALLEVIATFKAKKKELEGTKV